MKSSQSLTVLSVAYELALLVADKKEIFLIFDHPGKEVKGPHHQMGHAENEHLSYIGKKSCNKPLLSCTHSMTT